MTISGFTVQNTTAYSNAGIYLDHVEHCNISDNNASNNKYGIYLWGSSNNTLTNNTASDNSWGINLRYSSNSNTLTDNTANSNWEGIYMVGSSNNNLTNNTVNSNNHRGIFLYSSSNYNTLTNNTVNSNNNGISLLDSSNNNLIYNNYFNNTNNAYDNGNNIWNITITEGTNIIGGPYLGGNYWSDYTGEDLDHDCLGDTPYDIPGGTNKDYLPLLLPYTHTDVGVTVDIELSEPGKIEPLLPPGTDLSNAIVINVNVTDDTPGNPNDDAYTDITINVGELDVETCEVYKEGSGFLPEVADVTTLPTVDGDASFSRDVANNSVIVRLYVGDPLLGVIPPSIEAVSDTDEGTYPSIMGTHEGTITPNKRIVVHKMYTYPCVGTGGHTEYVRFYGIGLDVNKTWNGYTGDYHNIIFDPPITLQANTPYNYEIRTGSYPQIIHEQSLPTANGTINCTQFTDANGKTYNDWIPAIRRE